MTEEFTTEHQDIEVMLIAYRNAEQEIAPLLAELKELGGRIKKHILETGELVRVEGANTSFRKGYTRSSWDNKGLRGYAVAYPEVLDFLKETEVGPAVSIRVDKS